MDELLNVLLPFAQDMLAKNGEFFPFGAGIDLDGDARMLAGGTETERPASQDVIDTVVAGTRENRAKFRAFGLAADVRANGSDAIRIEVETADGAALTILIPYKKKRLGRGIEYGNMSVAAGTPRVFS
jgi:hypothetical protein